ncbi:uncharacterized protein LOC117525947 isoform X4 [Thalassophryne amazonica]|uniref:uncharacterized protein LOC117525947 isoform X4 n=1 Tax=Thalassophryne amazonica TaxID=390379 RepID=UPI001470E23B|nr:uncharacterized protein LOC117525947 isoform X4 [Thalassophryne amazonica]
MSEVQILRALLKQRLPADDEEIFELFERTTAEYEEELCGLKEENERQRKLLDAAFNSDDKTDIQQLLVNETELPPEQQTLMSHRDREEQELNHIKKEEEELWTCDEQKHLLVLDINSSIYASNDVKPQSPLCHQPKSEETREAESLGSNSAEQMKTEDDKEDWRGLEPIGSDRDVESSAPPSEHDAAGCASKPLKKKRQPKLPPFKVLSDKDRVDIMEWFQQHPMLYDKACEDYNNKEAKKQLYQDKARELGIEGTGDEPGQRLQTWVKTQRDKVGRLMKMSKGVSGSGTVKMTAMNGRFLKRFGWIHQYRNVKNIRAPSVVGLNSLFLKRLGWIHQCRNVKNVRIPSVARLKRTIGTSGGKEEYDEASDQAEVSRRLSSTRATITDATNVEKDCKSQRMFAELIFHETSKMNEEVWNAYYLAATQQLHHFRSLQIKRNRERQQTQQQFQPSLQYFHPPP